MTAADLVEIAALPDEAIAMAQPGMQAEAFVHALLRAGHLPQSVRALAHAMPPREAIAWAADCVRKIAPPERPQEKAAFEVVEGWLANGADDERRMAFEHAEKAFGTASGALALAVFLSGGSVTSPPAPEVPPAPHASAKAAAGAIAIAVVSRQPEKAAEKYRAILDDGMRRARELKLW
jgi:hypothetical protein